MWSFGILLYKLVTFRSPFPYPGMHTTQVLDAVQAGYCMPCPTGCSEQLYDMMLKCWNTDAAYLTPFLDEFLFERVYSVLCSHYK